MRRDLITITKALLTKKRYRNRSESKLSMHSCRGKKSKKMSVWRVLNPWKIKFSQLRCNPTLFVAVQEKTKESKARIEVFKEVKDPILTWMPWVMVLFQSEQMLRFPSWKEWKMIYRSEMSDIGTCHPVFEIGQFQKERFFWSPLSHPRNSKIRLSVPMTPSYFQGHQWKTAQAVFVLLSALVVFCLQ